MEVRREQVVQMETKRCIRCRIEKPISGFGFNKETKDGRNAYCKECRKALSKDRRDYDNRVPRMSGEAFVGSIDFKWKEVDGQPGEWHYRWTGKTVSTGGSLTPLQRFCVEIGIPKPDAYRDMWCQDEAPGCINPDHLTELGELAQVSESDLYGDEVGYTESGPPSGFTQFGAEDLKRSDVLRTLERMPLEPDDAEGSKFLRKNGYNYFGEPLKKVSHED